MKDLRQFIQALEKEKEIVTIEEPVDVNLELAEIHRRVIAADGPALFFRRPHLNGKPYNFPAVSNLFGSSKRIDLAFGKNPKNFIEGLVKMAQEPPSPALLWKNRKLLFSLKNIGMKRNQKGAVLENSGDISLDDIPLVKQWDKDGGFFITLPLVYTEDPHKPVHNLGMYRMQRHNSMETGMHWQIHKGGGFHYQQARSLGQDLAATIFIGGPPALILSAIAPLPENVGELLLASLLMQNRMPLTQNMENGYPLISTAEFAIVGRVDKQETRPEGPFGDHYGYYSLQHPYPVFKAQKIYHRKDAIYPLTIVGKPIQEDFFVGDYLQELLSPLFPMVMPGIQDLWSYGETGYHSLSAAVVKERYPREAIGSAFAIFGQGQLTLTKFLLMLDESIDLKNFKKVFSYILERADFKKDLMIFDQLSMDTLDYTGPEVNKGSKALLMGIGEPIRKLNAQIPALPPWVQKAAIFVPGCLVIETGKSFSAEKMSPQDMISELSKHAPKWPLFILADDAEKTVRGNGRFLWTVFTRFEPAADIYASKVDPIRNAMRLHEPLLWDCRMKPNYPDELFCDENTFRIVSDKWQNYFPQGMEMGDSQNGHLDRL